MGSLQKQGREILPPIELESDRGGKIPGREKLR